MAEMLKRDDFDRLSDGLALSFIHYSDLKDRFSGERITCTTHNKANTITVLHFFQFGKLYP